MKKLLVLALVLVFAISLIGCTAENTEGEDNNLPTEESSEEVNNDLSAEESSDENSAQTEDIKMGRANYAAHGDKSFAVAVVAMQGDTIVGASLDEFQFLPADQIAAPVPNSDGEFGENYKDPNSVLGSKITNNEYYSTHMAEEANATNTYAENINAIESYVKGKTVEELQTLVNNNEASDVIDAVSGATLADTSGYIKAIIEAANNVE
ncbi:hypothetical protein K8M07_04175 [Schnuerera sp. xch1]|uniref:hypothetical protein n=1 Tax=Schnuerera sp. xch1 TaxID=2874283 RepID=UPI001CC1251D|nr:hypothetical protein [Schnuerera sp. xch1]MBZ2174439.1 hypothetical protein [Schnuerera sp. xch1]